MSDISAINQYISKKMTKRRLEHTNGVRDLAVFVGNIFQIDTVEIESAALLHDLTKELSEKQQLQLCRKYDIIHHYSPSSFTKCIHADTAAEIARDLFGVSADVYNAIKYHTTARREMSELEKLIYTADKCEPTRDKYDDEAIALRELLQVDLNTAFEKAFASSKKKIIKKGDTA